MTKTSKLKFITVFALLILGISASALGIDCDQLLAMSQQQQPEHKFGVTITPTMAKEIHLRFELQLHPEVVKNVAAQYISIGRQQVEKRGQKNLTFSYPEYQPPGTIIAFQGQSLKVVQTIGAGTESISYLVETPRGRRVLKWFHAPAKLNTDRFEARLKQKVRVPEIYGIDSVNGQMLVEYIEGIHIPFPTDSERHGFTAEHWKSIQDEFARLKRVFKDNNFGHFGELITLNILIDIHTGEFILVDP